MSEARIERTGHHAAGERWTATRIGRITVLLGVAIIFAVPMITFALMGFRHENPIGQVPEGIFSLQGLSLANAQRNWDILYAFNHAIFTKWIVNSLLVALGGTALAVLTAVPAGYALAKLRFPGRRPLRFITLLTMVMPNTVLVIPLFLEVSAIKGIGQLWPVIVIMGFYPFGVYLSYIHFLTALPLEMVEAARIDGLSEIGVFARIALPVSKQAVALVIFFAFVADWTNYFLPLVLLPLANQQTLSVGLQQLIGSSPLFDPTTSAGLAVKLYMPQLALAMTITIIPVMAVFIGAQRYLMRGQVVGAVKG
jgi:multiple sugar transport system permease protein